MKRILITGVAGFIGFHLSMRLLKEKYFIVGIDNINNYYDISLKKARLKLMKSFSKEDQLAQGGDAYIFRLNLGTFGEFDTPPETSTGSNFVSPSIPTMTSDERTEMERDEAGRDLTIGTGMNEGQDSGPPLLSFDLGGMGTEGEAVPPPSGSTLDEVQAAIDLARGQGGDSTIIQSEIGRLSDLMNRQTTVTGGDKKNIPGRVDTDTGLALNPDARTVSSLEQLASRAGKGSEGISGFIERFTGFNPAASMYEDIVNNNYSPIYDNRGQIIGTINPETGQLGKGSRPIDTGAISSTDSDLKAFRYNQFADRNLSGPLRSYPSSLITCSQPFPASPTRYLSGTNRSSKKT